MKPTQWNCVAYWSTTSSHTPGSSASDDPTHEELGPPTSIMILKKCSTGLSGSMFSYLWFPLPNDSSLCQVGIKLTRASGGIPKVRLLGRPCICM